MCFVDAGGVVDDRIRDHADARGLALPDHVLKFSFGAFFGVKFVAYRLIARPPLRALDGFLRRRDLHIGHTFRTIGVGAFLGDRVPRLLERNHLDIFLLIGLRFGLRLGHDRCRDQRSARHGRGDAHRHHTA